MSKAGRWTQVEPTRLFVGAEGGTVAPPKSNRWRNIAIIAGVAVALWTLAPSPGDPLPEYR